MVRATRELLPDTRHLLFPAPGCPPRSRPLQAPTLAANRASWQPAPEAEPFHLRRQPVAGQSQARARICLIDHPCLTYRGLEEPARSATKPNSPAAACRVCQDTACTAGPLGHRQLPAARRTPTCIRSPDGNSLSGQREGGFHDEFTLTGSARIRSLCVFPCSVCPRQGTSQTYALPFAYLRRSACRRPRGGTPSAVAPPSCRFGSPGGYRRAPRHPGRIQETVLLYHGGKGRPRAWCVLTDMTPTQQRLGRPVRHPPLCTDPLTTPHR